MNSIVFRVIGLAFFLSLGGCSGPLFWLPGGSLTGPSESLSAALLPQEGGVLVLETRPEDPYSVNIGYTVIEGDIYIDPAAERRWYQHIDANPAVRIQLQGAPAVHPARAVVVEDPQVLARFEPDRIVLRLEAL